MNDKLNTSSQPTSGEQSTAADKPNLHKGLDQSNISDPGPKRKLSGESMEKSKEKRKLSSEPMEKPKEKRRLSGESKVKTETESKTEPRSKVSSKPKLGSKLNPIPKLSSREETKLSTKLKSWRELYVLLIKTSVRSRMQYRFNFILGSVLAALIQISEFLMVAIVLYKFGAIQGWSLYEIGYLFSVITLSKTLYRTFADEVHHLEKYLVDGELDQILTRPVPVLLAIMPRNFRIMLGELLQGGFILCWSMNGLWRSGQIDWASIVFTLFIIVTGAVILFSIGLATATIGFWTTRIEELQTFTEDAARTAGQYPLTLYPKWMSSMLLIVIPVGFVNYVPALYIIRGELGAWVLVVVAAVATICLGASMRFWRFGITKYQSTGS